MLRRGGQESDEYSYNPVIFQPDRSDLPAGHFMGPETNASLELPEGWLLLGSSCRRDWTPNRQCLWWLERTAF